MPAPDQFDVYFDDDKPPIQCASLQELDSVLDGLHRQANSPLAVAIKFPGYEIDMGLGADPTFLCLQVGPCDGEYYFSVGEETNGDTKMFYGAGQDSYWRPKRLIPLVEARQAVRHFVEHRSRSCAICWQDWNGRGV